MNREVPIEITSRHDQVSDRMREYAQRKVEKLVRFHNRISRIQVVAYDPHSAPEVELIVHVDSGTTMVAKERGDHFNNAIDALVVKASFGSKVRVISPAFPATALWWG